MLFHEIKSELFAAEVNSISYTCAINHRYWKLHEKLNASNVVFSVVVFLLTKLFKVDTLPFCYSFRHYVDLTVTSVVVKLILCIRFPISVLLQRLFF